MLSKRLCIVITLIIAVGLGVGLWSTTIADNLSVDIPNDQAQVLPDAAGDSSILIGGTPVSCGYVWDEERGGWHRPWDTTSFVPAEEKPDWKQYIP